MILARRVTFVPHQSHCQRHHHPYHFSLGPPSYRNLLAVHSRHSSGRPFTILMSCSIVRMPLALHETFCLEFKYPEKANQRRVLYLEVSKMQRRKGWNQQPQSCYGESTSNFRHASAALTIFQAPPLSDGPKVAGKRCLATAHPHCGTSRDLFSSASSQLVSS